MPILILDPGLFDLFHVDPKSDQFPYLLDDLSDSIGFAQEFLDVSLENYCGAPYYYCYEAPSTFWEPPPTTWSFSNKSYYVTNIQNKLRKLLSGSPEEVNLTEYGEAACSPNPDISSGPNGLDVKTPFLQYLSYIAYKNHKSKPPLLLLSEKNKNLVSSVSVTAKYANGNAITDANGNAIQIELRAVTNPATDCNGVIPQYLRAAENPAKWFPSRKFCDEAIKYPNHPCLNGQKCKFYKNTSGINVPKNDMDKLPCLQFQPCGKLNTAYLREKKKSPNMEIALQKKYGEECALRNRYQHRHDLSRINGGYMVFEQPKVAWVSVDTLHGGLELFDDSSNHNHQGEYNFACVKRKDSEPQSHKIKVT